MQIAKAMICLTNIQLTKSGSSGYEHAIFKLKTQLENSQEFDHTAKIRILLWLSVFSHGIMFDYLCDLSMH